MSIALSCVKCGKAYEMPDSLAGKRARCKQCGHEFRIPVPASVTQSAHDPYDLGGAAARPLPRARPIDDEDDLPPPPRAGIRPVRSKSRSSRRSEVDGLLVRRGISFFVFGVGVFVLPFFGLQFRILGFLGETVQLAIGVICLAVGSFYLARSGANAAFAVGGFLVTGVGGIVFLGVLAIHARGGRSGDEPPPRIGGARPAIPPGFPAPDGSPPREPELTPNPTPGFPPTPGGPPVPGAPGFPPAPGAVGAPSNSLKVVLSNARVSRGGSFGGRELQFSVDYRLEGGAPPIGQQFVWVIESPGSKVTQRMSRLATQGTLSGRVIPFGPNQSTTFETYVALETIGPGGPSTQLISDKVSVQWSGEPAPSASPGFPTPPGPPPMPRPPFGPRGRRRF